MSRWKIIPEIEKYFVTTTTTQWQNIFTSEPYFEVIVNSLKYCMQHKGLHVHGYIIMPNHVHYIFSTEEMINLSNVMRDFNTYTSRKITTLLKNERRHRDLMEFYKSAEFDGRGNIYKVWQEGFHPIAIESEKFFLEKLQYIHDNPVRKGFTERAEYWKYSSARNYIYDDHTVIKVDCL